MGIRPANPSFPSQHDKCVNQVDWLPKQVYPPAIRNRQSDPTLKGRHNDLVPVARSEISEMAQVVPAMRLERAGPGAVVKHHEDRERNDERRRQHRDLRHGGDYSGPSRVDNIIRSGIESGS